MSQPVGYQKNDLLEVVITDIGSDGEGIGHTDAFTLFVKDALPGDTVLARIVKPKKTYAYARTERVLAPSPFRIKARCEAHRACGGCRLQTLSYEEQLHFKEQKVRGNLIRIGGFDEALIDAVSEPVLGMEQPWRYRNKAQIPVGTDREGNPVAGFYAGRTHSIVPISDCVIEPEEFRVILDAVLGWMKRHHIPAYDEAARTGLVRHILLRKGFATGEIQVCLVVNGSEVPESRDLIETLRELELSAPSTGRAAGKSPQGKEYYMVQNELELPRIVSVCYSSNTSDTNVILGHSFEVLWGTPYFTDRIGDLSFRISPLSFYQVNPAQTMRLYEAALEYADLSGDETVWDLYCGIGTISLFLARRAGCVLGVEIVPQAIENARENARQNGIENAAFFTGAAEDILPRLYDGQAGVSGGTILNPCTDEAGKPFWKTAGTSRSGLPAFARPDVIVVDPPRKGCDGACLDAMRKIRPERIVYVSCDSATLARDLKILCADGYELKRFRPVDMFPHTGAHIETVALLTRT